MQKVYVSVSILTAHACVCNVYCAIAQSSTSNVLRLRCLRAQQYAEVDVNNPETYALLRNVNRDDSPAFVLCSVIGISD